MKIGDTIVAKEDFATYGKKGFKKNQKYTIENIYQMGRTTTINPFTGEGSYPVSLIDIYVVRALYDPDGSYHLYENDIEKFYTLEEIRKIKFNNIAKLNHV